MFAARESFDLFMLDWHVPDLSGEEVVRWLREKQQSTVPVLFATSRDAENDIVAALQAGADDYMVKPVRRLELLARVDALVRRTRGKESEVEPISIGPYLVTKDEIADPQKLPIKLWVNGEVKQDFNTDDMAHDIARCIEWASSIHTLEPGDILATGTNHRGLSSFMDGDVVELETQGLGRLRFYIKDELKRTWLRETRLDRQQKGLEGPTPQVSGKYT